MDVSPEEHPAIGPLPQVRTEIPGPRSRELAARLRRVECRNVTFLSDGWPVFWHRAAGTQVWDVDDNRFLDLTSAFGVAGLGHSAPEVVAAQQQQAAELAHAMGDVHPAEAKVALLERLSEITFERWGDGPGRTTLGCSGSDAIEIALKTSLLHSGKAGVIAFEGSYHGLGLGAVDACGIEPFRKPFRPQLGRFTTFLPFPSCYRCPFGIREDFRIAGSNCPNCSTHCLETLRDRIEETVAQREIGAILVEPVQGRGGIQVPPRDFLPMLREICDLHKILLIADEIYTGFNRTGKLFAVDHSGIRPDLICLGKGMASGYPISACVGRADVMEAWPVSEGEALQTSTFLGNPVGCAMAVASINQHGAPERAKQVRAAGRRFRAGLEALDAPAVGNVRGLGLMLGLELVGRRGEPNGPLAAAVLQQALRDGMILLADGPDANVLAFTPPFGITENQIEWVLDRLQEYLTSLPGSIS